MQGKLPDIDYYKDMELEFPSVGRITSLESQVDRITNVYILELWERIYKLEKELRELRGKEQ